MDIAKISQKNNGDFKSSKYLNILPLIQPQNSYPATVRLLFLLPPFRSYTDKDFKINPRHRA